MFKEIQSLIKARNKSLTNAENKVKELTRKNEELTKENLAVHDENKDLRFENEEQKELINNFIRQLYLNLKTDEQKITKLKELVSDWQSLN